LNDRKYNGQRKRTKWETTVYKALNRNLNIEKREPHDKSMVNSGRVGSFCYTCTNLCVTLVTTTVKVMNWKVLDYERTRNEI
jgi:hypothetical protein